MHAGNCVAERLKDRYVYAVCMFFCNRYRCIAIVNFGIKKSEIECFLTVPRISDACLEGCARLDYVVTETVS